MSPWKISQFESHIKIFPEGQICVEYDDIIIGSSSSLIINFDEYNDQHSLDEITDNGYITNHNPEGYNLSPPMNTSGGVSLPAIKSRYLTQIVGKFQF
ncbi:MAG: hypothetical protein JM58_04725 [Peptococcaceae bacterium BICA1-8]|nr:MAG: hypothetical protein JM58_04725 [Peptococcaceae bacterium BICA1-8]